MKNIFSRNSELPIFLRKGRIGGFLTVVFAGQLTYSAFEAFKGSLMIPLTNALGIGIDQFGILMGWLGIAMFLYIPGGWVNNRFTIRSILIAWAAWRMVTALVLFLVPGLSFSVMVAIAISWGVWDAIGWPAVVNGVSFMSQDANKQGRGLAMGMLESIRRAVEFSMNLIVVGLLAIFAEQANTVMTIMGVLYSLIIIPLIFCILKFVPKNATAKAENPEESDNIAALKGLVKVLLLPRVWLAGIAGLCVYWCYVNLIYSSAPYLSLVFNATDAQSGAFGIFNTGLVGIFAGVVSGLVADYLFKSSTRMMAAALALTAIGVGLVYILPQGGSIWVAMFLLMVMALGIFMGKAVILAPIAELHLPEEINGSAMAVGSFLVYASIFWANPMTAAIVESHRETPHVGYQQIFLITLCVALVGAFCAILLDRINARVLLRTSEEAVDGETLEPVTE
ncbi:MFS transporter [Corynebacterium glucuronolyticum]|uniref:MFS transporter n=3 Tax=Corynebacterium glucuronolyticum TaxID=39791 RepID=A0A7T4JUJ8_9CORY|nr:MFS transporter [Corynebacterium glucuronolyticum]EEI63690.1 transporter, major facilitator family protein [Corynebacterium glucuronolyticum ATCC 51866]QQB45917.1 MFS transporter [Corynebacterium glucuronolyticum]QRP71572.1 MFS transporter [Corynebacterium glucuronolyticum]WKD63366.1 Inner membrane protein YihN [Corynebacterium glucuronolyticum DSM 44120]SMB79512.1 Sugar phosphate permease [Corynebacterium glucuronolyticum]